MNHPPSYFEVVYDRNDVASQPKASGASGDGQLIPEGGNIAAKSAGSKKGLLSVLNGMAPSDFDLSDVDEGLLPLDDINIEQAD